MILCCGEALIDMIPAPLAQGGEAFAPHCGGAVFNTAIALGRLGVRTGLMTGLSTDMFGRQLADALAASAVDASLAVTSDRPSTLAFVRLANGSATYNFFDNGSAGRMLSKDEMPTLDADVTALFFGGISLACEPAADAYASLCAREGATRAVMVDPNIRPAFIEDEARYRDRLSGMIANADIVKVSDEDLNWIVRSDAPLGDKARALLSAGPSLTIVTRGHEGAHGYLAGGEEVHVDAARADIVDTVGAGDTFNAGVLAKLQMLDVLTKEKIAALSVEDLRAALALGARVAAVTVSRAGANPPWASEIVSPPEPGAVAHGAKSRS
ncbi:MAG: carbohydrate kinase [Pseudomonadota bacterium]